MGTAGDATHRKPWNKGKIVGQKAPFKLKDIWALRVRLQIEEMPKLWVWNHDRPQGPGSRTDAISRGLSRPAVKCTPPVVAKLDSGIPGLG